MMKRSKNIIIQIIAFCVFFPICAKIENEQLTLSCKVLFIPHFPSKAVAVG